MELTFSLNINEVYSNRKLFLFLAVAFLLFYFYTNIKYNNDVHGNYIAVMRFEARWVDDEKNTRFCMIISLQNFA